MWNIVFKLSFYDFFLNFRKNPEYFLLRAGHIVNISSKYCEYSIDLFLMCGYTQFLIYTFHCFVNMCWLAFTRSWEYDSISVYIMRCSAVWLKIVQACQINLVLSCGVCFLMEKLVEIWHFYEYFLKKCYYENLFTLNL